MEEKKKFVEPKMVSYASKTRGGGGRRGGAGGSSVSSDISGVLSNIHNGISPISHQNGDVNVRDAVLLCQKAYWNVAIFRLTIDVMAEFANSNIQFRGKNKSTVKFFDAWYKKIRGWNLGDQFFRELFRSSNVFLYRLESNEGVMGRTTLNKIPIRYILLNPADIMCSPSSNFTSGTYKKILNDFELSVLKDSKDPKNLAMKKALPKETQKEIDSGGAASIELKSDKVIPVFFKKQDYEPMAVPMYFPVLFDINLKLEFKKAEQIVARACEYMILLITVGDKENGVDQILVDSIQNLFQSESVGRVFVSDWTTKMDFILPDLQKILGPAKYEAVNQDIANGLMNIFFGDQKYADSMIKIRIFLERLKEARKSYLNDFLIPEMESICEKLGFRECPTPIFEEFDIRDEVEYMKLYNRLAELGLLTQEETLEAYKTHLLPETYDSLVSQEEFKKQKDKGLYAPLMGKKEEAGRPTGIPQKQKQKKVTPVGQGSEVYSVENLKDIVVKSNDLIEKTLKFYKEKYSISRASKKHKEFARKAASAIIQNEPSVVWEESIAAYVENPMKVGPEFDKIVELAGEHSLDFLSAGLLYHSLERGVVETPEEGQ